MTPPEQGSQADEAFQGEIKTNNMAEQVFAELDVPELVFVRCAYFMENWLNFLGTLKAPEPLVPSTITPLDWKVPMVAVRDIGATLAAELTTKTTSPPPRPKPQVFELQGPQDYSPLDVRQALKESLRRDVPMKPIEKEELHGFYSNIFPPEIVPEWVEMTRSFLPGGIMLQKEADVSQRTVRRGRTRLSEVIGEAVGKMQQV
jgi:uncharacterized protein YbjT (DUF2867 family)